MNLFQNKGIFCQILQKIKKIVQDKGRTTEERLQAELRVDSKLDGNNNKKLN